MNQTKNEECSSATAVAELKPYAAAFKREAVEHGLRSGRNGTQIAPELKSSDPSRKEWQRRYAGEAALPRLAKKVTIHSMRFWLFITAGVLSQPAGKPTVKRAVPPRERDWWRRLWEKILSPLPNCNAVENRPAFTT